MRNIGADMIVLRPCYSCGEWPYLHKPDCPVQVARDEANRKLAEQAAGFLTEKAS